MLFFSRSCSLEHIPVKARELSICDVIVVEQKSYLKADWQLHKLHKQECGHKNKIIICKSVKVDLLTVVLTEHFSNTWQLNTVWIRNPTIQNIWNPDFFKSQPFKIRIFLSDFKWFLMKCWPFVQISDPIWNQDHLRPNLFLTIWNPD